MRKTTAVLILVLAAALVAPLAAQQARVNGRITDPGGAVIPAATVLAQNEATGVRTEAQSNELGIYVLPFLQPGRYSISVTQPGFKRYQRTGFNLQTADVVNLDIALELGDVTESVTITAEAPLLESASSTVSQMIDSRVVSDMPLSGRRALELTKLIGGAVFINYSGNAKPNFSLSGGRVQNQMFMLDGGNIQNMRLGIGQVDTDPPVEVIKEFRVVQNGYSAEYGGSASGLVISTTKSGTNQIHGSAFHFFRNDAMDAAGFFAPIQDGRKVRAPLRYNLYGGTIGGPVIKDRTHFFGGYEGTRRSDGETQVLTVPTDLQRGGDFSQSFNAQGALLRIYDPLTNTPVGNTTTRQLFANNVIPQSRFDAVSRQLIDFWPRANKAPVNVAGAQNFSANRAQRFERDNYTVRVDHVFSNNNRFYYRGVINKDPIFYTSNYPDPIADPQGTFTSDRLQNTHLFADTHTLTPNLIFDMRFTLATRRAIAAPAGLGSEIVSQIGLRGVPSGNFPVIAPAGFANIGNGNHRLQAPIRQQQYVPSFTWIKGSHLLKFGGEFRRSTNYEIFRQIASGQFNFALTGTGIPGTAQSGNGFATFLLGFVNGFQMRETDVLDRYSNYMAWFVQDDWKVTPTLTLNLGMRWETDTPITDFNNHMNGFDMTQINPVSGTPGVVKFMGQGGFRTTPYNTDWNNYGPRIGFAWRPFGSNRWVMRGGFGIFFEHPFAAGAPNSASLGYELSAARNSPDNGVTPAFFMRDGSDIPLTPQVRDDSFGAVRFGQQPTLNVTFYEEGRRTGYAQMYNLSIQREFARSYLFEVQYLGNLGRKMPISNINMNQVPFNLLGPGNAQTRRPFPQFNAVNILLPTMGANNYHAGVAKIEKRLSGGLSFLSTYTFARNIGNINQSAAASDGTGDNQNFMDYYNRRLDKGPLSIDIIHRWVNSSIWDLPFGRGRRWATDGFLSHVVGGWQIGAISTVQSGGPFTVTTQTNTTNAFSAGGLRANRIGNGNLPGSERSVNRWFDLDAFVAPPDFTFGNAGRGILRGDNLVNLDFSLLKNFSFGEQRYVQFRVESFNAMNHPDFALPNRTLDSPGFGAIGSATSPRTMQLGLRIIF